jgi:hypothetical protein
MGRAGIPDATNRKREHHPARSAQGWRARCAVLFNCRTTLVETFRERFPNEFEYQANRALLLKLTGVLPAAPLSICLSLALTYHLGARNSARELRRAHNRPGPAR